MYVGNALQDTPYTLAQLIYALKIGPPFLIVSSLLSLLLFANFVLKDMFLLMDIAYCQLQVLIAISVDAVIA